MKLAVKGLLILTLAVVLLVPFWLGGCAGDDAIDGGSISGHVYEADGVTPIAGVDVSVMMVQPAPEPDDRASLIPAAMMATLWTIESINRPPPLTPPAQTALIAEPITTGDDGSYSYTGLLAGKFIVVALADGYVNEFYDGAQISPNVGFSISESPNNWKHWAPGTFETTVPRSADLVTVATNRDTPGIDFTLAPSASISGRVLQADGEPYGGEPYGWEIPIRITDTHGSYYQYTSTNFAGSYNASGLPSGEYEVYAWYVVYPQRLTIEFASDTKLITLAEGEQIAGINFTLPEYGAISGGVFFQDLDKPYQGVKITAESVSGPAPDNYVTFSKGDGSYVIFDLPPGGYRLRYHHDLWGPVRTGYYAGNYSVTPSTDNATPVRVETYQNTSNVDIVIRDFD